MCRHRTAPISIQHLLRERREQECLRNVAVVVALRVTHFARPVAISWTDPAAPARTQCIYP